MGRRPRVQWSPPPSRSIPIDGGPGPVAQPPSPYVRPASAPPRRRAPSKDPVSVQSPSSPKGPPFERGPGPNFQPRRDLLLIRIPTPSSNLLGPGLDQAGRVGGSGGTGGSGGGPGTRGTGGGHGGPSGAHFFKSLQPLGCGLNLRKICLAFGMLS